MSYAYTFDYSTGCGYKILDGRDFTQAVLQEHDPRFPGVADVAVKNIVDSNYILLNTLEELEKCALAHHANPLEHMPIPKWVVEREGDRDMYQIEDPTHINYRAVLCLSLCSPKTVHKILDLTDPRYFVFVEHNDATDFANYGFDDKPESLYV